MKKHFVVIGGGAAGFFSAINAAERNPDLKVTILEKSKHVLQKVKVSGGGRCNVTHACFVPNDLVKNYPRGERELRSSFSRFQPGDTMEWFESRGVALKIEDDGRIFPVSNSSQTIIDCLQKGVKDANIEVLTQHGVTAIEAPKSPKEKWQIYTSNKKKFAADAVMVAAGSSKQMWKVLDKMGHSIVPPVPSLFTFNIKDHRIEGLAGIAVHSQVKVIGTKLEADGPLLITHWGMSGPGILKLSAWGANILHQRNYDFQINVNWLPNHTFESMRTELQALKTKINKKQIATNAQFQLPTRLWKSLVKGANISEKTRWADISKKQLNKLATELTQGTFEVKGKSTFKDEFVTCGGVKLKEVDFKTMQSKLFPNLFFGGEILNIDAITGGFNFQAAWTAGWIISGSL